MMTTYRTGMTTLAFKETLTTQCTAPSPEKIQLRALTEDNKHIGLKSVSTKQKVIFSNFPMFSQKSQLKDP